MKLISLAALVLAAVLALSAGPFVSPPEAHSALSGIRPDPDTEILDLDAAGIADVDREELAALIDGLPCLYWSGRIDQTDKVDILRYLEDKYKLKKGETK